MSHSETNEDIQRRTVAHYNDGATQFWEGTKDHDVQQNRNALLTHLQGEAPHTLLDLGCGPGRDLKAFKELGHNPIGLDAAPRFCAMARAHAQCEVWQQHFLAMNLPATHFDGIFANASLFHVPTKELPRILGQLRDTLKSKGVLFTSNPRGDNQEGWNGNRYGTFHDKTQWDAYLTQAGFHPLDHYYRPPGKPRHEQPWLATLWRKP